MTSKKTTKNITKLVKKLLKVGNTFKEYSELFESIKSMNLMDSYYSDRDYYYAKKTLKEIKTIKKEEERAIKNIFEAINNTIKKRGLLECNEYDDYSFGFYCDGLAEYYNNLNEINKMIIIKNDFFKLLHGFDHYTNGRNLFIEFPGDFAFSFSPLNLVYDRKNYNGLNNFLTSYSIPINSLKNNIGSLENSEIIKVNMGELSREDTDNTFKALNWLDISIKKMNLIKFYKPSNLSPYEYKGDNINYFIDLLNEVAYDLIQYIKTLSTFSCSSKLVYLLKNEYYDSYKINYQDDTLNLRKFFNNVNAFFYFNGFKNNIETIEILENIRFNLFPNLTALANNGENKKDIKNNINQIKKEISKAIKSMK